ncbi:GDSL-type esterase/lipase family protein [Phenylobacterium sp. LjRoot164]|uniref:GDSL-type esterase/lipase family protein n=1 Tax=unclassified Phenylobacterium TaxID=2640670 RepID=UPI003ECC8C64
MLVRLIALSAAAALAVAPSSAAAAGGRFTAEMEAFAAQDKAAPQPPCKIVFTGSSTIRLWTNLSQDMGSIPVINRGFGGAEISDVNAHFDQVVGRYRPRAVVFYAGENDLNAGESRDSVAEDFGRFMKLKSDKLGASTPVYFISLKPSQARERQILDQSAVNAKIKAQMKGRKDFVYIDVVPPMMGADGHPKDLFVSDGLHMNSAGYAIWTKAVRPVMEREMKADRPACRSSASAKP